MANAIAYGFEDIAHLLDDRLITEIGIDTIEERVRTSFEVHNRIMDELLSIFCEKTTEHKVRFLQEKDASLQPLDAETGRAMPVRFAGHYDVAWPLQSAGIALAHNKRSFLTMTGSDINRRVLTIQQADRKWVRYHILAAIFSRTAWTYTDEKYGDLTIQPVANSDTVTYFKSGDSGSASTDDHFLAQAAGIDDANNIYKTMYDELNEHPENSGADIIALIPTNLVTATEALEQFHVALDPNIELGIAESKLRSGGPNVNIGTLRGYEAYSKTWIYEWAALPSNYAIGAALGGEKALRMREVEDLPQFRGFYMDYERENAPFYETQFKREAGFGAWGRTKAVAAYLGGGAWSDPTGYTAPIP